MVRGPGDCLYVHDGLLLTIAVVSRGLRIHRMFLPSSSWVNMLDLRGRRANSARVTNAIRKTVDVDIDLTLCHTTPDARSGTNSCLIPPRGADYTAPIAISWNHSGAPQSVPQHAVSEDQKSRCALSRCRQLARRVLQKLPLN